MRIRGLAWALLVGGVIMYFASWCVELALRTAAVYVLLLPGILGSLRLA